MDRLDLQSKLESVIGSENVYFQPPETVRMAYPCIVYSLSDIKTKFADNAPYDFMKKYQVTVIDKNPDSAIPDKIAMFQLCVFDRHYTANNLNHYAFNLYF